MSLKKIQLICELLTEQMNHWMLFPIALTMMEMTRGQTGMERPDLLFWALCGLFPLLFFALRLRHGCKKRYLFLLWHIAAASAYMLALSLIPRPSVCRRLCILCGIGYLLHSLILQLKKNTLYTTAIQLPIGMALSFVPALMRQTNHWKHYYIFSLIAVIAMFFMVFYMRQYLDYMNINMGSAGYLDLGEIFRSGTGMVAVYTLFGTVLLIISVQREWLAKVLMPLGDFLVQLVRALLAKILPKGSAADPEQDDMMTLPDKNGAEPGFAQLPEPNEPFWFWRVLEIVVTLALIAGLVYLAARLFWKLLTLLQEYLNRRMARQNAQDQAAFDIREKCDIRKTSEEKRQQRGLLAAHTNRERIRRLYKRKLLAYRTKVPDQKTLGLFTAREWERRLQAKGMADIYELARYSESEVTAEDVKRMREICSEKGGGAKRSGETANTT